MSVFKSQFSRALAVIPSDNNNVPFPAINADGVNTSAVAFSLVDSAATFISDNVATGDIVYNTTDGLSATVVSVTNETTLILNADIFGAADKVYIVYQASPQYSFGNGGCNLYIGGAGNVRVTTIGGDILTFFAAAVGQVLPVQVIKVHGSGSGTSATNIVALW